MRVAITDAVHAAAYLLPGIAVLLLATALWRAGREAAALPAAPRWARRYARATIAILLLTGVGLLAAGGALGAIILRR